MNRHAALVGKLVLLYADTYDDRADLRQEILYQAWKAFPGYRGDALFSTWLYRIALNTSLMFLRQRRKNEVIAPHEPEEIEVPPAGLEAEQYFHRIVSRLTSIDKTILAMNLDGFTDTEISSVTGLTHGNVRTRLTRIRAKVRKLWKD